MNAAKRFWLDEKVAIGRPPGTFEVRPGVTMKVYDNRPYLQVDDPDVPCPASGLYHDKIVGVSIYADWAVTGSLKQGYYQSDSAPTARGRLLFDEYIVGENVHSRYYLRLTAKTDEDAQTLFWLIYNCQIEPVERLGAERDYQSVEAS